MEKYTFYPYNKKNWEKLLKDKTIPLSSSTKITLHSNIDECEKLWRQFSSGISLFDEWDFRVAFYKGYNYPLFFITFYSKDTATALIPLWYNEKAEYYEYFGGVFQENNKLFYTNAEDYIQCIQFLPFPFEVGSLLADTVPAKVDKSLLHEDVSKYEMDITKYKTFDQVLSSFSKKHRYNLRYDYKKIDELHPEIKWISNVEEQIKLIPRLAELSHQRFNTDGDKSTLTPEECKSFEYFLRHQIFFKAVTVAVKINGEFAAVDIIIEYKDLYYLLSGANDLEKYKGVGTFMFYIELEDALKKSKKFIDAGQGDCNWKHKYFQEKQLIFFENKK